MSHLDTVHPVGTIVSDLPLRIEGDRLYGPGIYDMKAGAWFALEAFKDVARKGNAARPMIFIVTPDEEIGSPMTRPIIEGIGRRSAFALVTEPARDGGKIVTSRKGVGRFDVHVEGRPAHAGFAPSRRPQRHLRGRAADPRRRGPDGLYARRHDDGGHDLRRHGREHHPAALPFPHRPARRDSGRWRGADRRHHGIAG